MGLQDLIDMLIYLFLISIMILVLIILILIQGGKSNLRQFANRVVADLREIVIFGARVWERQDQ